MFNLDLTYVNIENFKIPANEWLKNFKNTGTGFYIDAPKHSYEWIKYWDEQEYYCKNGYSVGGVRITGEHYFYLNFCQIQLKTGFGSEVIKGKKKVEKLVTFPDFWDSDWFYFTECELAREAGQHMIILKPRRRGYSYKNAAKCAYNYTFLRKSTSLIIAESSDYSEETMGMAVSYLDFLMKYTDFGKNRLINKPKDEILAGYEEVLADGTKARSGSFSRLLAMTAKNNASVARGKDANVILFEEAGSFSNLKATYAATRPTVEEGLGVSGQIFVFGCVCAGTKVWTNSGHLVNIENLKQEDGILGYDNHGVNTEPIIWMQPPAKKPCYRITTLQGTVLECSEDHPLFWSYNGYSYNERITVNGKRISIKNTKKGEFKETKNIQPGEQIAVINAVPIFGTKKMWQPRVVGMLIGDGNYGFDKTPRLFNCDLEINTFVSNLFETKVEKEYLTKDNRLYKETRIKNICPQLKELGIYGQTKLKKRLPVNIFDYDKNSLCELIAGLFDTDGYIGKDRLVLTASSKDLLEEVKNILIKIGVHSYVIKIDVSKYGNLNKKIKDVNDYYRLMITDFTSIVNFHKNIFLLIKYKQEALNNIIKHNKKGKDDVEIVYIKRKEENKNLINKTDIYGIRFESVKTVEFIGEKDIYNLTAGDTHTYIANNIITHNTGGDFSAGIVDFDEMFYNPEPYNFRAYSNIWEEGMELNKIGYFLPDYYSKGGFISAKGESQIEEAKIYIEGEIENKKRTSKDPNAVDIMLAEFPRTPKEAFIKASSNIFPKAELQAQINFIKSSKIDQNLGVCGELIDRDGEIVFNPTDKVKPIDSFPLKKDSDREGCFIQYQSPYKEEGRVPNNLYYIGHDPYGVDSEKGESLGALFVFKQVNNISQPDDLIVAEYVARPSAGQDEYNRIMVMIAKYYNAKIGFENDRGNVIQYCRTNKVLGWLQEEADIYDKGEKVSNSLSRGYGMSMSNLKKKQQGCLYLRDWLLAKRGIDSNGKIKLNLNMIYSVPLLEELIKFDYDGNFDRVSACIIAMYYQKQIETKPIDRPEYIYNVDPFFNKFDSLGNFNSNY